MMDFLAPTEKTEFAGKISAQESQRLRESMGFRFRDSTGYYVPSSVKRQHTKTAYRNSYPPSKGEREAYDNYHELPEPQARRASGAGPAVHFGRPRAVSDPLPLKSILRKEPQQFVGRRRRPQSLPPSRRIRWGPDESHAFFRQEEPLTIGQRLIMMRLHETGMPCKPEHSCASPITIQKTEAAHQCPEPVALARNAELNVKPMRAEVQGTNAAGQLPGPVPLIRNAQFNLEHMREEDILPEPVPLIRNARLNAKHTREEILPEPVPLKRNAQVPAKLRRPSVVDDDYFGDYASYLQPKRRVNNGNNAAYRAINTRDPEFRQSSQIRPVPELRVPVPRSEVRRDSRPTEPVRIPQQKVRRGSCPCPRHQVDEASPASSSSKHSSLASEKTLYEHEHEVAWAPAPSVMLAKSQRRSRSMRDNDRPVVYIPADESHLHRSDALHRMPTHQKVFRNLAKMFD
ncbi:uncharacterized protein FOMMEDRAFT_145331 [Fomitiporia mediterranea MF3/22]|uniref:uncharacterized protein n=1 Tax=Fomitiporia mediterranea (strain MF3/22) TaxID=694068 RepID=UPI00044079FD|nr:uncharacterized protein FOMMEDRAFT_145331 [Fomitiporia mediterranea MF3/22]EJD05996.1 hypothetical protein FOMMEDRAFT_145331 [Fomitiporia mediterranea MF3/22]